jgi:hypothetical protein
MAGRSFIDWNGSGGLDSQDLVTGVALDTAERDNEEAESDQQSFQVPNPVQQSASGCLFPTMVLSLIPVLLTLLLAVF